MFSKILHILTQHISPHDTLVVGVSGGPDSTALLDILVQFLKSPQLFTITVAHINHGIRGVEADRDETFVHTLAKSYGCRYEVKRVKLAGKTGLEERGRKIRRDFFEKLRAKYKAKWILTAHTEDDQLETIVFNFLRGSGPAGLAGMKIADGFYLKPLLTTPKSEILAYLKSRKLTFRVDSMNNDTRLRRVFIRKKILPLFTKINPSFHRTILQNSKIFENIEQLLENSANQFLEQQKSTQGLFRRNEFLNISKALQCAVIEEAYRRENGATYRLPFLKVEEVRKLLTKGVGNKRIECGAGSEFFLKKGILFFDHGRVK